MVDAWTAHVIARKLMDANGLEGWKLEFVDEIPSSIGNLAGHCDWDTETIRLDHEYVARKDNDTIERLIKHEIAHALSPTHNHDEYWRMIYKELLDG